MDTIFRQYWEKEVVDEKLRGHIVENVYLNGQMTQGFVKNYEVKNSNEALFDTLSETEVTKRDKDMPNLAKHAIREKPMKRFGNAVLARLIMKTKLNIDYLNID